jgi:hypothetical protein
MDPISIRLFMIGLRSIVVFRRGIFISYEAGVVFSNHILKKNQNFNVGKEKKLFLIPIIQNLDGQGKG